MTVKEKFEIQINMKDILKNFTASRAYEELENKKIPVDIDYECDF